MKHFQRVVVWWCFYQNNQASSDIAFCRVATLFSNLGGKLSTPSNFRRLRGNIPYLWTIPYMMSFLRSRHFLTVETLERRDKNGKYRVPKKRNATCWRSPLLPNGSGTKKSRFWRFNFHISYLQICGLWVILLSVGPSGPMKWYAMTTLVND